MSTKQNTIKKENNKKNKIKLDDNKQKKVTPNQIKTDNVTNKEIENKTTNTTKNETNRKTLKELDEKTRKKVLLYIVITLGIFYFVLDHKLKQKEKTKTELSSKKTSNKRNNDSTLTKQEIKDTSKLKQSKKIPIEVEKLITSFGGKENLLNAESTLSTIQLFVNDKNKVNKDEVKKIFSGKGISIVDKKFSIICGDYASELKEQILKIIKKENKNEG